MRPSTFHCIYRILKKLFPDVPVVLGGIEACAFPPYATAYRQDNRVPPQHPPRQRSRLTHLRHGKETCGVELAGKAETPTIDTDGRPKLQKAHRRYSPNGLLMTRSSGTRRGYHPLFHEECLNKKKEKSRQLPSYRGGKQQIYNIRIFAKRDKLTVVVNPPYPLTNDCAELRSFRLAIQMPAPSQIQGKRIRIRHDKVLRQLASRMFLRTAFCTISAIN